jgi:4-hydroxy-2-oxoglutarate aldolase
VSTPFTKDGEIEWGAYAENMAAYDRTRLSGLVSLGSNGEFTMLSFEEKVALVAATRKGLSDGKVVIAGTGCESLKETVALTKACADAGADAALVVTPNYYKKDMTDAALEKFFSMVADASPIPVMLYNMPGNSGVNIPSALTIRLSKHPNITGIKDSGGNIVQIAEVLAGTDESFSVFAGSGSFLMATTLLGGVGGTLALANVVPNLCVDLYEASVARDIDKARKLQLDLMALNAAVTAKFGIGGMKSAMEMVGYRGGMPRLPILPATDETKKAIRAILERLGVAVR